MKDELIQNMLEIITFANLFGKTTGIPIVNIHNNSNPNIYLEMRNHNTQNDFMYIICDNMKIIGYNAKINRYKCASMFPDEFHLEVEKATLEFTKHVMIAFHHDINRFKLLSRKLYTTYEAEVAIKYLKNKQLKFKTKNEFNKWRKESIPLIEYKSHEHQDDEILDVQIFQD